MAAGASAIVELEEEEDRANGIRNDDNSNYSPLHNNREGLHEGPAALQLIFRILEARGPKDSMNLLRDVLESMKLVQAITGTGAAASFVHANSYTDTRGEAFGVLTALSTILAFLALIVTVIMYVSLGLLEHEDMLAVEGYLVRYWSTLACIIISSVLSMILLVAAVVVDSFRTYSMTSSICLLVTTVVCLMLTVVFWVSSTRYVFTTGATVKEEVTEEPLTLVPCKSSPNPSGPISEPSSKSTARVLERQCCTEPRVCTREGTEESSDSDLEQEIADSSRQSLGAVLLCR